MRHLPLIILAGMCQWLRLCITHSLADTAYIENARSNISSIQKQSIDAFLLKQ
jgi:hypothetical protein